MTTNTYVALDKIIVGTSTPSVTFTGISQAYTNLEIVVNGGFVSNNDELCVRFNGDTGNNYSTTFAIGDGGSAIGTRQSNTNSANLGRMGSTALKGMSRIVINDYKDPNINKTVLTRTGSAIGPSGGAGGYVYSNVSLWRATPQAITSMTFFEAGGFNILAGTTFSLYGILAEPVPTAKATGGTISYGADGYTYHTFTSSGTFTPSVPLTADALVIAGGGGGATSVGGGGGGGGLLGFTAQSLTAINYTVTVGAGGAAVGSNSQGNTGNDSQFGALTLVKGGGGGGSYAAGTTGKNGGSGGGAGGWAPPASGGLASFSGQGNNGGSVTGGVYNAGGSAGGGGAGGVGGSYSSGTVAPQGGQGSSAYSSWGQITNTGILYLGNYYYAGGGGGVYGAGGTQATATFGSAATATAGVANTGQGAGGDGGSAGGSGIVIIRYQSA